MDTLIEDLYYEIIDRLPKKIFNFKGEKRIYILLFPLKLISKKSYLIVKNYYNLKKIIYCSTLDNFIKSTINLDFFGINISHFNWHYDYIKLLFSFRPKIFEKIIKELNSAFYYDEYKLYNNIIKYFLDTNFSFKKKLIIENDIHPNLIKMINNNIKEEDRFLFDCLINQEFNGKITPKTIELDDIISCLKKNNTLEKNIIKLENDVELDISYGNKTKSIDIGIFYKMSINNRKFNIIKFILKKYNKSKNITNYNDYDFIFGDMINYYKINQNNSDQQTILHNYLICLILNLKISDIQLFKNYLDLKLIGILSVKIENIELLNFYLQNQKNNKLDFLIYLFNSNNFKSNNIILQKLINSIDKTNLIYSLITSSYTLITDFQKEIILYYYNLVKEQNLDIKNDIDMSFELLSSHNYNTYISYLYEIGFTPNEEIEKELINQPSDIFSLIF
jgi:hypothetical protein